MVKEGKGREEGSGGCRDVENGRILTERRMRKSMRKGVHDGEMENGNVRREAIRTYEKRR